MDSNDRVVKAIDAFSNKIMNCTDCVSHQLGTSELQVKQINYLYIIDANENLTFSGFAEILKITKPSVTEIVNKLIKTGCVTKRQSEEDGRIYYIELTERGRQITNIKKLGVLKCADDVTKKLNDNDLDTLIALIQKITEGDG